jgi:hypothetical protein
MQDPIGNYLKIRSRRHPRQGGGPESFEKPGFPRLPRTAIQGLHENPPVIPAKAGNQCPSLDFRWKIAGMTIIENPSLVPDISI